MRENDGRLALPGHERAHMLLRAGELKQARAEAQAGLDTHGPHAGLYEVLGRAHAAEDDDDHDAAAERAFRAGLDAFPDDLDLLAAYAGFGLAADGIERPGRLARGRRAAERLAELAPGSPQARQLAAGGESLAPRPPALSHLQRHDARTALNSGADLGVLAAQAREAADAWPYDRRLAVRAETLAALAAPHWSRAWVAAGLRSPYRTALILCALAAAWLLAVPALGLSWPHSLWGLLVCVPVRLEQSLLRGARRRAERRLPDGSGDLAPGAPDVPLPTGRERAALALALVIAAGGMWGSVGWQYARATEYPHYEASVPRSFHGIPLDRDGDAAEGVEAFVAQASLPRGAKTFGGLYRDEDSGVAFAVAGATGDLHAEDPDDVLAGIGDPSAGDFGLGVADETWTADPGRLGGRMKCAIYPQVTGSAAVCMWADKGSVGLMATNGGDSDDHDTLARIATELRRATLRPTEEGAAA